MEYDPLQMTDKILKKTNFWTPNGGYTGSSYQ